MPRAHDAPPSRPSHMQNPAGPSQNRNRRQIQQQPYENRRSQSRPRATSRNPSRGQGDSQWIRSTSKGRSSEMRDPTPGQNRHIVQGLQKNKPKHEQYQFSRRNRSISANQSRGRSRSRGYEPSEYQQDPGMIYKDSVHTKKSNYSDTYQVRSVSNRGQSGSIGILEMNIDDEYEDADYFVR